MYILLNIITTLVPYITNNMQPQYIHYADISLLINYELPLIEKVFKAISYDWGIEYNFPHGGCQQRAQLISLIRSGCLPPLHYT